MSLVEDFSLDWDDEKDERRLHRPSLATNFNPQAWKGAHLMGMTGPYAYALNFPRIGECKPGFLFMKPHMDGSIYYKHNLPETADELEERMRADGLYYYGDMLPRDGHVLAFFLKPKTECRPAEVLYLRRDSNNRWSYREITEKGGCRNPYLPRQHDFSGRPVTSQSILKADFGAFSAFLGFASIPHHGIYYYRRIRLPDDEMKPFFKAVPADVVSPPNKPA